MKKSSWIIVQPVVPDYRVGFFQVLSGKIPGLRILCGAEDFSPSTKLTTHAFDGLKTVKNRFLLNRKFLWQHDVVSACLKADLVVLNFNIRILSTWIVLALRRIAGRPVLLWGHVSGKSRALHLVRYLMMRLSNGFIAYTEDEMTRLSLLHPMIRTFTAPNACLPRDRVHFREGGVRERVLLVGRLVEGKKPLLAVTAFLDAVQRGRIPTSFELCIVGSGPLLPDIQGLISIHPHGDRVKLVGHVNDEEELEKIYGEAVVSLSTGYLGLSAMQSFAFGVPMLVARDEPHSPEVAMCEEGGNTYFVSDQSSGGWSDAISDVVNGTLHFADGSEIAGRIRESYSFEAMAEGFAEAVRAILKEKGGA